jgi:hypothetical protein
MITTDQIAEFKTALATAAWKMDLWTFARICDFDADHVYTQGKFLELNQLVKALGKFDAETLTKIINTEPML